MNKFINNETFIQLCGYKKPHPLIDNIIFNVMILPTDYTEIQKVTYITEFLINVIVDIKYILEIIKSQCDSTI